MALRRSDGAAHDVYNADKITIPVPNHLHFEKEIGYNKVDVPDISQSFSTEIDDQPRPKQHRKIIHPKEPILQSKCHEVVFTDHNAKIKHIDKAHCSDFSPKLNDENRHPKIGDGFIKHSYPVGEPSNQKQSETLHSTGSSDSDLWEYLKRLNTKLDTVQEQVSHAITPTQSSTSVDASEQNEPQNTDAILAVLRTTANDSETSSPRNCSLSSCREELLIKYLLYQGEQIQKLQEQTKQQEQKLQELQRNWLLLNIAGSEKVNPCQLNMEVPNITSGSSPEMLEGFLKGIDNQKESPAPCPKDIEVSKQSTSTMTSMTYNGADKFVIHKKLTVVTDSSKYQKEVSAQCSYISNGVNSSVNLTPIKSSTSSVPKRAQKSAKSSKKNSTASGSSDDISPKEKIHPDPLRKTTPSSGKKTQEKKAEVGISESNIVKVLPNYQNILKIVNEVIADNPSQPVKSGKNTTPKENSKPRSKKSPFRKTSPMEVKENEKQTCNCHSSSSTNSSHDSPRITPKSRKQKSPPNQPEKTESEKESNMKARYGLSSPDLSVATREYLENYGLVRGNISSEPRRKSRKSLPKRCSN